MVILCRTWEVWVTFWRNEEIIFLDPQTTAYLFGNTGGYFLFQVVIRQFKDNCLFGAMCCYILYIHRRGSLWEIEYWEWKASCSLRASVFPSNTQPSRYQPTVEASAKERALIKVAESQFLAVRFLWVIITTLDVTIMRYRKKLPNHWWTIATVWPTENTVNNSFRGF